MTSVHKHNDPRIFYKECLSLVDAGYEVHLVAPGAPTAVCDGVFVHGVSNDCSFRPARMTRTVFLVLKKALEVDASVYHFHDPELIFAGVILKLFGKKVIYDVHEDVPQLVLSRQYIPRHLKRALSHGVNLVEKSLSAFLDYIVTATEAIEHNFKPYNKNTCTVKNYLSLKSMDLVQSPPPEDDGTFRLIFIGVIYNERGISQAVAALNLLQDFPVEFLVYGPVKEEYLEELRRQDVHLKMKYGGVLAYPEIFPALQGASAGYICDLPFKRHMEGLPVKLFDYMASGLPVIASDFPLWREIVEGNNCGICVDPLRPEQIAQAVRDLHADSALRAEMGRNGLKGVTEKYNWELESAKLRGVYAELV